MLKFTAMSCERDCYGKFTDGFASINVTVTDFGAMNMQVSCYDSYESSFSKLISKLPGIRNMTAFTDFQNRMSIAAENIMSAGELIIGFYRRDITMFNSLIRELKRTKLNARRVIFNINCNIRELEAEAIATDCVRSFEEVVDMYDIDISLVQELACIVFGVDYYAELPKCATRAAFYCCVKMKEEGYNLETVLEACTQYMVSADNNNNVTDVVVNLTKGDIGVAI